MKQYQELWSQKYLNQSAYLERKAIKNQRDRDAIRALVVGLIAMFCLAGMVQSMPIWIPMLSQFIDLLG